MRYRPHRPPRNPRVERIPGGLSEGMERAQFDPVELARGIEVELEHTTDRAIATEIAMDHLVEDPAYYRKLALIESPRLSRHGACVVVVRAGRVLTITKGRDLRDLNLPGGGVDPGESFGDAAIREMWEETRVDIKAATLIPIQHRRGPFGESVAYAAVGDVRFPARMYSRPFEGFVQWHNPQDLLQPCCTHADVNRITFGRLQLI